jgi:hypothetical protein
MPLTQKQLKLKLKFKLLRTDEDITPRTGLAFYSEGLKRAGVESLIKKHMPLSGSNRGYDAWEYVHPIVLMLIGGGRHIEDIKMIGEDKALRRICEIERMPSSSTIGDWIRRMGSGSGLYGIKKVIDELNKEYIRESGVKEFTLWSDPTIIEAEKESAEKTYEGVKGYRPVVAALQELSVIIGYEFRNGNTHGVFGKVIDEAFKVMPEGKKIRWAVLDSEYYSAEVINNLSRRGVKYFIVADQDRAVMEAIKGIKEWKEYIDESGIKREFEIGEAVHCMGKSEEAFRIVVKRWKNEQLELFEGGAYRYHVIATNSDLRMEEVIRKYEDRGQMENIIKELKIGFSMEQMPSGDFYGNAFWFSLGVLAYNIFVMMKDVLPEGMKRSTIGTVRWRIIEVAGRVIRKARQIYVKVCLRVERFKEYLKISERIEGLQLVVYTSGVDTS